MATFVEYTGTAKLDRRTKRLVKRIGAGDIAIIDHPNLDRISAEELLESGVRVVVNVSPSSTGEYPNAGPLTLVRGGVCLIDAPGAELFDDVREGEHLVVRGSSLYRNGTRLAAGLARDERELAQDLDEQRSRVSLALEAFAENTLRHLREETALLSEDVQMPQLRTRFRDRHALVVARSPDTKRDLSIVGPYIADFRPVLVAVDGGADALLAAGYKPDVIVGDMDSVSDRALQSGAELVVHAYADGRAPGRDRLDRIGLPSTVMPTPGISEDAAMLLAYEKGAELIVAVGTRFNLIEFLERNRAGMASTFLTRLKVGEKLVDARGVSRLFRPRIGFGMVGVFALASAAVVTAVLVASPELRRLLGLVAAWLRSLVGLE
ncbi:MAG TPA: putative cytokinetic ring protein SteA [Gaiellaceae bacterium]|nr:putative cytokinetic ring protein SteA [Gaiellaceae bacterium]